jgi:ribonuclease BN (tRNA processing enzyme)
VRRKPWIELNEVGTVESLMPSIDGRERFSRTASVMSRVVLIPLGVGEAFTARYYTSAYVLGIGDDWLLIECPHPVRKMLREASIAAGLRRELDLDHLYSVVVSHLHADHCCGLEDLGYYSFHVLGRRAKLLMHADTSARLWNGLLAAGMELTQSNRDQPPVQRQVGDFFDLIELSEAQPVKCGPFSVECRRTIHSIPTFALRITAGDRMLGYSADTAYDPALITWLAPANLIIHEATTLVHTGVHTPYESLAALPASLRSRMRLTHYPDDFDVNGKVIEALRQGQLYEV